MPDDKIIPIKYTSRDFTSIRRDLLEHARRYYPNTYKDFNEASFGSFVVDSVAYIGDMLSFYLDYQANESFLDTAAEYKNILKLSRTLGYKFNKSPSSYGVVQLFLLIPASTSTGEPDMRFAATLKEGTRFSSDQGGVFTLLEDVDFSNTENKIIVARVDETNGAPTYYAIKSEGQVVSGELLEEFETVGEFKRFLRVELPGENIADVVSVFDSEGHEFVQVDHLSQDVVFKPIPNTNSTNDGVPNLMKKVAVPRRFVVEHDDDTTFIQFGYGSDSELLSGSLADTSDVVLKRHGRSFVSDASLDPTSLGSTDKFGVAPSSTTLRIVYRSNTEDNVNASSNSVTKVVEPIIEFKNITLLSEDTRDFVVSSLEVTNEKPILGDVSLPSTEEIKIRALNTFATQNRAVTREDYESLIYSMPAKFGAVKRCCVEKDPDSFKRNLNIYVLSENREGHLTKTNPTIKNNLKTWLDGVRMINDTIDILDGYIVNIGIEYDVVVNPKSNKFATLRLASKAIEDEFKVQKELGEPLYISDFWSALKGVEGILDVKDVRIINKVGAPYSETICDIKEKTSTDGRSIIPPRTYIFELKYPNVDIKGNIL
jgi:hypothetical protein